MEDIPNNHLGWCKNLINNGTGAHNGIKANDSRGVTSASIKWLIDFKKQWHKQLIETACSTLRFFEFFDETNVDCNDAWAQVEKQNSIPDRATA